jgi:putative nucleotidyltransferase with HDIG domain
MMSEAARLLAEAVADDRAGRQAQAVQGYAAAAAAAQPVEVAIRAEALRRHGALHRQRQEFEHAMPLCQASYAAAVAGGDDLSAAEALNAVALVHLEQGSYVQASTVLEQALVLAATSPLIQGRIEQNLGIIANIKGDYVAAVNRYRRSLSAFREANDDQSCAVAYHNLGMISADQGQWDEAERYFASSLAIVTRLGNVALEASVLLNRSEVHMARGRYGNVLEDAGHALRIFSTLGNVSGKADANRWLGIVYRETDLYELAEIRLRTAIALAQAVNATLVEAESRRELASLCQKQQRNQDAFVLLNEAHRLFGRLEAGADDREVTDRLATLENMYLDVAVNWGRSIESTDTYTFGHSWRVASCATRVARCLGLDEMAIKTIRIGSYLHDVGKIRLPHELLIKPGKLTADEYALVKQHTVWGVELLANIEFPWQIETIVRSHHEKRDGSGYPDGLWGDEVPLNAEIVCIADVFDALTSVRSYQAPVSVGKAVERMRQLSQYWHPDVFDAFATSVCSPASVAAQTH